MAEIRQRRSPRLAIRLPIRVYGTDFRGTDFVEDSSTLVVNLHGAKIRLIRQLIPEQEIRIACRPTEQEAVFRVVCQAGEIQGRHSFWGVETLSPEENIWGVSFPAMGPEDRGSVRVLLQCPKCLARELHYLNEPLLQAIEEVGGLLRACPTCKATGLWKQIPYGEA
jgi:hypothetical protein